MAPPYEPPLWMPAIIPSAMSGDMPKVRGMRRAMPIVAVRPGMAPKMMPPITPTSIARMFCHSRMTQREL